MSRNSVGVTVIGNLTDNPELRFTSGGRAVCRMSVAVNERIPDPEKPGQFKDGPASFYTVDAWGQLAENCAESLGKGSRVIVAGTLRQESWQDRDDPTKTHYRWKVSAHAVGPDLSWATATVKKMSRTRQETPPDDPWATGSREPVTAGVGAGFEQEPPF